MKKILLILALVFVFIGCKETVDTYNNPPQISQYVSKKKKNKGSNEILYQIHTTLKYDQSSIYSVYQYSMFENLDKTTDKEMSKAYSFWGKYYYPRTNVINKIEGGVK